MISSATNHPPRLETLELLARRISRDGEIVSQGDGFSVRCPAHEDSTPSLSIAEREDGKGVVIHCHAGCSTEEVCRSKGMTTADLFYSDNSQPLRNGTNHHSNGKPSANGHKAKKGPTVHADYGKARGALEWGVNQKSLSHRLTAEHVYKTETGLTFGVVIRFREHDEDGELVSGGSKDFRQMRPADGPTATPEKSKWVNNAGKEPWPLYRLDRLPPDGPVCIHEGEEKCDVAADRVGLPSVTSRGGAKNAKNTDWRPLAGREVWILPDNNDAGEAYAQEVTGELLKLFPPARVKIVRLEGRPKGGDIADLAAECQDDDELVGLRQTVEILADEAEPQEPKKGDTLPRLMLQSFEEIESRAVDWLWPMRIVAGGLTILTGPVGNTKSMLTIDLASRVSLGTKHPDGTGVCPAGKVLMFGHEDAVNEVVKPRLVAAGANCANVFFVPGKIRDPNTTNPDEAERVLFSEDIDTLRRTLEDNPGIKLLIFDPLPEFIRGDHNAAAEVREALMPLSRLAQEFGVAIVAVCHQNKKVGLSAVQTIAGSGGFVQVARTVLAVINDPEDTETGFTRRRLMVVAKSNYGGNNEAQAYRLIERMNGQAAIEWLPGVLEVNADEILRPNKNGGGGGDGRQTADLDGAVELVLEIMGRPGTQCSSEAELEVRNAGHSRHTVKDAKTTAGVISKRVGGAGGSGSWEWAWKDGKGPREPGQPAVTGEPVPIDEWEPLDS